MKATLILLLCFMVGCSSSNEHGKYVGLNGPKDPTLEYNYDAWNIVVGLIFVETLVVPVVVALDYLECPAGKKAQ